MAEFGRINARTATAAADLRQVQYHVLRPAAAGTTNVASNAAETLIGVLLNKPNSGQAASIGWAGEAKIVAGGTVTANGAITTNSSGRAADATSGDWVLGMALEAATTNGEVVRCILDVPTMQLPSSLTS